MADMLHEGGVRAINSVGGSLMTKRIVAVCAMAIVLAATGGGVLGVASAAEIVTVHRGC